MGNKKKTVSRGRKGKGHASPQNRRAAKPKGIADKTKSKEKRLNRELLTSQDQYRQLIQSLPMAIYTCDVAGNILLFNEAAVELWGRQPERGRDAWCGSWKVHHLNGEPVLPEEYPMAIAIRDGRALRGLEVIVERPDGTRRHVLTYPEPIRDAKRKIVGAVNVVVDITERMQLQAERLRVSQKFDRQSRIVDTVLSSINDFAYIFDREGKFLFANQPLLDLWGLKLEEAVGKNFFELNYPPLLAEKFMAQIQQVFATKQGLGDEAEYVSANGQTGYYEYILRPVFATDGSVEVVAGSTRDITERKLSDQQRALVTDEIQRLSRIYETILSTTEDFAYILDREGRFLYANRQLLTVWAKTLDQIVGRNCHELGYPAWHADMHMREIARILATKKPVRGEVPYTGDSGISGVYDYIFMPVLGPDGEVEVIVGTTREISERKRSEEALRAAQEELSQRAAELETKVTERTAKLTETVGDLESFSYSIVHDMRAPLRSMQGYASALLGEYQVQLPGEAVMYLERISNSAHRMDLLIQDVLTFSRVARSDLQLQPVDTDFLLRDILETYPDLRAKKEQVFIEGKLPAVIGNEAALTQCFSNLIGNALKFTAPGTPAHVRIWAEQAAGRARIFVEDEGIGIPQHLHERIFELFQRANRTHEGTGIGLPIVRKSVERMGGKVGMSSFPGQGSVFWLELNLAAN